MDGASSDQKRHPIAQQRAQHFKEIGQQSTLFTRARSRVGQPVTYGKVKEKANITRHSRVMSDPDIPGALVILNAKGLFQGKNGNGTQRTEQESRTGSIDIMDKDTSRPVFFDPSTVSKETKGNGTQRTEQESRTGSIDIMDKDTSRPVFFDPSTVSKETKVCDLRKRCEPVGHDITGDKVNTGSEFLNPLHKVNQEVEGENLLAQQQNSETEDVVNGNDGNNHDDEDDDDDDDEWDTDFDDDSEDDDNEERVKRDSQSSHGSSCGAETLVSYIILLFLNQS